MRAGYDPTVRDAILDREGVAAEVLFPDADVLGTGRLAASPFGSGLGSGVGVDADAGPGGRPGAQPLARRLLRHQPPAPLGRGGRARHGRHRRGRRRDPGCGRPRSARDHDPDPLVRGAGLPRHVVRPGVGGVRRGGPRGPHPLGRRARPTTRSDPGSWPIYAAEAWWWAARPFWVLVLSGVFERHPTLKYSIAENGAWWVPDIVAAHEREVGRRPQHPQVRRCLQARPVDAAGRLRRPQLLVRRRRPPASTRSSAAHAIGVGNLLWGNDLPHPEGTYPHTRKWIAERFRDVPDDETVRILGQTAAGVYGVDVTALADLVERIGPTHADVHG